VAKEKVERMSKQSILDTYVVLVKAYATKQDKEFLIEAQEVGRELVTEDVPIEEIVKMHEEALKRLDEESPHMLSPDTRSLVSPLLIEVMLVYGVAFREHVEHAEQKFRQIFDQSNDGILIFDFEGNIKDVNLKAQEMWGYSHAEFLALNNSDLHSPHAVEKCQDMLTTQVEFQENIHATEFSLETEFKRKDESVFYGEVSESGMNINGQLLVLGVVRDITRRKQMEAEKGRLQEELADEISATLGIMDTAADGIITINDQGHIESYNKAARRMFGYEEYEVLGKNVSLLMPSPYHEEHDGYLERYRLTGDKKVIGSSREVVAQRKDGTTFPLELSISEVQLGDRKIFTGITRDITERQQAEIERERLHKQFEDASRQAGMAEVATGVLHNVGNILTSVSVSVGMVRKIVSQASVEKVQRTAALIQQHAQNLGEFFTQDPKGRQIPDYLTKLGAHLVHEQATIGQEVQELTTNIEHINRVIQMQQTFAKSSGGHQEPVVLHDIMEQALFINIASLHRHGMEVIREYEKIPPIVTDRHQVLQILVNLIGNAKYAVLGREGDPGQLTLKIGWVEGNEDMVHLQVQDNGVGIKPDHLTRIFAQGFTTKKEGHGFGLHSAALSAKNLGGSLIAHSDGEGQGATFTFELPVEGWKVKREMLVVAGEE